MMKPWLLIKTGGTIPEIVPVHGDFEDWFKLGLAAEPMLQADVFRGDCLPHHSEVSAAVITGSIAMVSHREDWSEQTAQWLLDALGASLPVLGVCYGHQLLAHALGGTVGTNPRGREIGTVEVSMRPGVNNDLLFGGYPETFFAQTSHLESVIELPASAQRLGSSELDENLIARFSETAWGVQYHPEFSADVTREYIRIRSQAIEEEGINSAALRSAVRDTDQAASILPTFARHFLS
jgi:GMP synthase (glutamine-hydrolysing)